MSRFMWRGRSESAKEGSAIIAGRMQLRTILAPNKCVSGFRLVAVHSRQGLKIKFRFSLPCFSAAIISSFGGNSGRSRRIFDYKASAFPPTRQDLILSESMFFFPARRQMFFHCGTIWLHIHQGVWFEKHNYLKRVDYAVFFAAVMDQNLLPLDYKRYLLDKDKKAKCVCALGLVT